MSFDLVANALHEIRDNITRVRRFIDGFDLSSFAADDKTFYEASRRLPDELRDRHPHLPWRAIRDTGNFYRHQYDNVLESLVWTTIRDDLPRLLAVVEQELRASGQPP